MSLGLFFVALAMSASFVPALHAAVIVQYSSEHAPEDGSLPTPAAFSTGNTTASPLTASGDDLQRRDGSLAYSGWESRFTLDRYVGFTVSADPGLSLVLTHLSFKSVADGNIGLRSPAQGITQFTLAYRENWGAGFGAWIFMETYDSVPQSEMVWDFEDIYTTGIIEFALFATAESPGANLAIDTLDVHGSVPVPEPSVAILAGLSSAVALRRRRRN
ncbi:hypothetical protein [Luteolibacter luteus]|uniref:PEP-CTERM sorting domain-containing protein n=1 Tax=Luteolibacter luteus TaxID=2728835 RepID=A0A858RC08_9BACT|nr:hypothetical protein [Luteolibacter luteus]QJE94556.1 hypothetical protein HHL09_01740 [Luteolibacter luteus]